MKKFKEQLLLVLCCTAVMGAAGTFTALADDYSASADSTAYKTVLQVGANGANGENGENSANGGDSSADYNGDATDIIAPEAYLNVSDFLYTGSEITPQPVVKCGENTLVPGTDYDLSYINNTYAGTGKVVITYKGDYSGSETLPFTIAKRDISELSVSLSKTSFTYTGNACNPTVTLNTGNLSLKLTSDYYVTFSNNVNVGTATVTVTGTGSCTGSLSRTFTINPRPTAITSYTKTAKSVTLKWNADSTVSGYRIYRYSGSAWVTVQTVNGGSTDNCTILGLNAGSTYKFKIKTFTTVNGTNYWSDYSSIYTCTTKADAPETPEISDKFSCGTASIKISWNKVANADGYYVYRKSGSEWKKIAAVDGETTSYKDKKLSPNTKYKYKISAFAGNENDLDNLSESKKSSAKSFSTKSLDTLYYFKKSSGIYTKNYKYVATIGGGSYYTGYYNPHYPNYYVINYKSSEYLVAKSNVSVKKNATVLKTGTVGQYGGSIAGYSACGPTAATILVNSQLGDKWNKDNLIRYCENQRLNDQGSLRSGSGGITAPNLITLISRYSGGAYKAKNIYGSNPTSILKNQIDKGNRSIVVVQYTSTIVTHYSSGTHFVVVCGYEYNNGTLYFYYADPYYGNGGRSLRKISASVLGYSMSMVKREPRCIITVSK